MRRASLILAEVMDSSGSITYTQKTLAISPSTLIAYWPLNELTGTTADNAEGTAARDGAYTGVDLNNTDGAGSTMGRAGLYDGTNDYCNIYTASYVAAFVGAEGTFSIWVKMFDATVWADAVVRNVTQQRVDASNLIIARKTATANQLEFQYAAGGTTKSVLTTVLGATTAWFHIAMTWSKAADEMKAYINGAQVGATQTGLGTWVGTFNSSRAVLAASITTPSNVHNGWIQHCRIDNAALSPANIALLAVAA